MDGFIGKTGGLNLFGFDEAPTTPQKMRAVNEV
jgi:hypothetical protein